MTTPLKKLVINGKAPVTLTECVYLGDGTNKTLKEKLVELDNKVPDGGSTDPNSHTHINKTALDEITSTKVTEWDGKATETFVTNKIAEAQLGGGEIDLSRYATKVEMQLKADKTYVDTEISTISLTPGPKGDKGDKGEQGPSGSGGGGNSYENILSSLMAVGVVNLFDESPFNYITATGDLVICPKSGSPMKFILTITPIIVPITITLDAPPSDLREINIPPLLLVNQTYVFELIRYTNDLSNKLSYDLHCISQPVKALEHLIIDYTHTRTCLTPVSANMATGEITVKELIPTSNLGKLHFILDRHGEPNKTSIYNELRSFSNTSPERISDYVLKHGTKFTGTSDFTKWHIECGLSTYGITILQPNKRYRICVDTVLHGYMTGIKLNNAYIGNKQFKVENLCDALGCMGWNNYQYMISVFNYTANLGVHFEFILENKSDAFTLSVEGLVKSTETGPESFKGQIQYQGSYLKQFELSNGRNAVLCNGATIKVYELI